jgi:hypothetical protein
MIERRALSTEVTDALRRSPAVVLLGPRQVGKTTLARSFMPADAAKYLDLEDPAVEARMEDLREAVGEEDMAAVQKAVERITKAFVEVRGTSSSSSGAAVASDTEPVKTKTVSYTHLTLPTT